jgi:D-3-phosphoglycerate dehydrogenase
MIQRPDVLVIGPYPAWDLEPMERNYNVHRLWEAADKAALLRQVGLRIKAIATRGELGANAALIGSLPQLEIICCYGVGGIRVTNTPDVLTGDVADLALALMLGIARHVPQGDAFVRQGRWPNGNYPLLTRMYGKRLGIIGMGRIGQAIARRAAAFDMPIAYHSRTRHAQLPYSYMETAEELAARSDFLVAAVTGGAATARLVNATVLEALGPHGYFINVARGTVADEEALIAALQQHRIAGAALDVFLNEPLIDPRFLAMDNVVLAPHQGSATVETRKAMGQIVRDNLEAHFSGRPLLTPVS